MDHESAHSQARKIPVIRQSAPPGSSPGMLAVDPDAPPPHISAICYGPDGIHQCDIDSVDDIQPLRDSWPVVWINVDGLRDVVALQKIADLFNLHRLALEDVVNIPQRAKAELYDDHLFILARMVHLQPGIETEQVSIFVGNGYVLTFQEHEGDPFGRVRDRLQMTQGRIRQAGPDYLAYALLDALIDAYYPVLEQYGDRIEELEDEVLADPDSDAGGRIHSVKRELLMVRRALVPHREAINTLLRDESSYISDDTQVYLRDCYDHIVQLMDMVETYRELSSGLLDVHLTTVSNRMNEVMKVLTIFAAIFIPLSFIAGLYGMNFDTSSPWNLPELSWAYGYPTLLLAMTSVAGGLLLYFKRKGWL